MQATDKRKQSEFVILNDQLFIGDCSFQCLTNCPLPPGQDCIWDDPDYPLDRYEYPEHTFWRWDHEDLVRPEPVNPLQTRCPRCFSTAVIIGYPYIECRNCGYNESLIDFPISRYYHLALLQEVKGGRSKKGTPEIGAPFLLEKMKEKG